MECLVGEMAPLLGVAQGILKVCEDMGGDITLLNERIEGGEKIADILPRS